MKRLLAVVATLLVASVLLTACGGGAPAGVAGQPAAADAGAAACGADQYCVGFVTDTGGINDDSFNETQWLGIVKAQEELGVQAQYIQSDEATQYTPNLSEFAAQGYDMIIAAGFFLGADTATVAAQYPDIKFSVFDYGYPDPFLPEGNPGREACVPNVRGQSFRTDQPAFLAGYLAAGMAMQLDPDDPKLGYFGGAKIPTVTYFAVGMQFGMDEYNKVHGTNVQMVGWDNETGEGLFTGDFEDLTKGKESAESLFDEGVDIFAGVGGIIGAPGMDVARERGGLGIWVDTDGYYSLGEGSRDVMLTSILKNMDVSMFETVKSGVDGNFEGCVNYIGDIANGGSGLAPYHDLDSKIPADLKAEVEALKAKIISGEITDTGCISYPASCPQGLY